jgi:hypothetical protein
MEPCGFDLGRMLTNVKHHDDEQKQHHDCSGIDDQLECGQKRRAHNVENDGYSQERNNQVQQRMHGMIARDGNDGC